MSNLLQRLIDRTRAPLSAVQPILPSIYTPADRTENDPGPMSQTEVMESAGQPAPFSPRQTDHRESSNSSPPMSDHPVETRASPAAPAPLRREADEPTTSQQTSRPAPPGQDESVTPRAVEKKTQPPAAPAPVRTRLNPARKTKDTGPVTRTFVPRDFGSKAAKSSAKRADAGSIPGLAGSEFKSDVPLRPSFAKTSDGTQDFEGPAVGPTPNLQSPQKKSPDSKAGPATQHETAAKIRPVQTMPSLAATMKWLGAKTPPDIERPADAKTIETGRGSSPDTSNESSNMPMDKEVFSTRKSESPSSKTSHGHDRVPPVEVNVAIGHIEVKSVQPNPPAPRKPPQRPRFTLEEFLKSPHSGGLR